MPLNIDRLSADSIDVKPINMSWDIANHEDLGDNQDGIKWNSWESVRCNGCKRVLVGSGYLSCADVEYDDGDTGTCTHCDEAITFDGYDWNHDDPTNDEDATACTDSDGDEATAEPESCDTETLAEGPMMNYWYPVRIEDNADAARKLVDLPLCVVEVDGETGLALTGGGMDLSWEICEAFIRLGHYPPVHFEPPLEAGELSERRKQIVRASLKANKIASDWAQNRMDRLTRQFGIELPVESED